LVNESGTLQARQEDVIRYLIQAILALSAAAAALLIGSATASAATTDCPDSGVVCVGVDAKIN
jgi:hypothetical protein